MTQEGEGFRHPEGAWGWGGTAAAVAVAVLPQLVVVTIVPQARSADSAALTAALVLNTVVVASGIYLYLHHRLTTSHSTAWLAAGTIFAGVTWLTLSGISYTTAGVELDPLLVAGVDVAVLAALIAMVWVSERVTLRLDPAALGLFLGFAGSAAVIVAAGLALSWEAHLSWSWVLAALVLTLGVIVALEVRRLATLPSWARDRFALAIAMLTIGRCCLSSAGPDDTATYVVSVIASTAAAVTFLGTSLAILRLAIRDDRLVISVLQNQLASTAAQARVDRERLHEVKGTIAGIASASRLIHHQPPIPDPSRELLEEMLEKESARLQRLVHGTESEGVRVLDLDELLRPLVVARQAQGQRVAWQPSGQRVRAAADDLTAVLNILLDNAARHAPGDPVAIFAQEEQGHVRIVVADSGPGVPEEQRHLLFARGARGAGSTGDGLGLHVARHLMLRCGGYLRLDADWLPGAAFVVGVRPENHDPRERHDDATRFVAQ